MRINLKCIWIIVLFQVVGILATGNCEDQAKRPKYDNKLVESFSFYVMPEKPENFLGCGCSFHLEKSEDELVFISKLAPKTKTLMKIDGAFVYLEPKEPTNFPIGSVHPRKIGDKLTYRFTGGGAEVTVELTATSACPPGDEKCEGESYRVVITVVKGKKKQTLRVSGNCGC
jgi:hypothetical protein